MNPKIQNYIRPKLLINFETKDFRIKNSINSYKMNNYDYMVKIIIIGDSAVGKSNVLLRFTE
jgi:hypothetical protein